RPNLAEPEPERVRVLLRARDSVQYGTRANVFLQRFPTLRRQCPLDARNAESLGVRDVLADPAGQGAEVPKLHLEVDARVMHERKLLAVFVPWPVPPGAQLVSGPPRDGAILLVFLSTNRRIA